MTEQEKQELRDRVRYVQERVSQSAERSCRKPEDITLVAATKMNSAERVKYAIECGIRVCGENRVQELLEKYNADAYKNAELHFIGTLQTNKVKYLMGKASLIQSVSSLRLGETIAREAEKHGIKQKILLEVNIGRESSKSGFLSEEVDEAAACLGEKNSICVCGLMAIPPITVSQTDSAHYFTKMYQLFVDISAKNYDNVNMDCLSMGMTSDFETAIECGATMIRVGTAIFGARAYQTISPEK